MKHISALTLLLLAVLLPISLSAQWNTQTSGTSKTLHDVYFLNENYGVAVGDTGTILITTNGGNSWQPRSINTKNNIQSVEILGIDTILVAAGTYFEGEIYLTTNGGSTWQLVSNGVDLEQSGDSVFTLNSHHILVSSDAGKNWDTTNIYIGNTTLLQKLHFPTSRVGYVIGDISGFSTYSAFAYRSIDGGQSWTSLFSLDFPNNNSHTAAYFTSADTGYVFTNRNERFLPGRLNQLVKIYGFYFDNVQTQQWRFRSEIVNDSLPTYIRDAQFVDSKTGYTVGENGNIYKTTNGGANWTSQYAGNQPLLAIFMRSPSLGYAVGANGTIIKFNGTTSIPKPSQALDLQFYPNPTSGEIHLQGLNTNDAFLTIFNSVGQILQQKSLNGAQNISLNHLANGWYLLQIKSGSLIYNGKLILNK